MIALQGDLKWYMYMIPLNWFSLSHICIYIYVSIQIYM